MGAAPIPGNKIKWVAWLSMVLFTLNDKKKNYIFVVKCKRAPNRTQILVLRVFEVLSLVITKWNTVGGRYAKFHYICQYFFLVNNLNGLKSWWHVCSVSISSMSMELQRMGMGLIEFVFALPLAHCYETLTQEMRKLRKNGPLRFTTSVLFHVSVKFCIRISCLLQCNQKFK